MKVYRFKCKDCGATKYEKVDENTYKCSYCGYTEEVHKEEKDRTQKKAEELMDIQKEYYKTATMSEKTVREYGIMLILTVFFGVIGMHKFLERKFGLGVIYLFTWGLFGIGVFFDIISYVFKLIGASRKHTVRVDALLEEQERIINE